MDLSSFQRDLRRRVHLGTCGRRLQVVSGTFLSPNQALADEPCSLLIAQYTALSQLFASGFAPRRTILLSHGFDEEEVQARQGAGELSKFIEAKYGKDSMLLILDEGGSSVRLFDTALAVPATSEKGYVVSCVWCSRHSMLILPL